VRLSRPRAVPGTRLWLQGLQLGGDGCSCRIGAPVKLRGSDTLPAVKFVRDWYGPQKNTFIAGSVPATEHSVMCSYGRDQEFQAFERLLDQYPSGSLSTLGKIQNETSHFRLGFRSEIPNFHPLTFSRFHLSNLSVWRH